MKTKLYISLALSLFIVIISCNNDDFKTDIQNSALVNYTIQAVISETVGEATPENVVVSLTNTATGEIFETYTDINGNALFDNLDAGTYTAAAYLIWTSEEFEQNLGYTSDSETVSFSGAQENIIINNNNTTSNITLFTGKIGDLVIKQIYFAGSHLVNGAFFRDQFIEVYNNSNETVFADGLIFAQVFGSISTTVFEYSKPNGQYDWTKSVSNNVGDLANDNYVYADYVYQIPGNGTDYPILAGESIIIAATAINHKSPLLDNEGNTLSVNNPDLTVDLSTADFEAYLGDYRVSNGDDIASYDIQNSNVTDLDIVYLKSGKDMVFGALGTDSYILFRHESPADLTKYIRPGLTTESTNIYLQIPIDIIVDAVETNQNDPTNLYPKRLTVGLDGGYTNVPDGAYSSQAVIRKVEKEINGRKILLDTNNSSTDFTYLEQALPKAFAQ